MNKNSPCAHTKSELSMNGIAKKLGKYTICKYKYFIKKNPLSTSYSNNKQPKFGFKEF